MEEVEELEKLEVYESVDEDDDEPLQSFVSVPSSHQVGSSQYPSLAHVQLLALEE